MVQTIFSSLKILNKRQYGSTHIVFLEGFVQNTIWFNPYCLLRQFSPKDNMVLPYCLLRKFSSKGNMVKPILSFLQVMPRREYGSIHNAFLESLDRKTIWLEPYCPYLNFGTKGNMVQPI